jgi:hypothetical protein
MRNELAVLTRTIALMFLCSAAAEAQPANCGSLPTLTAGGALVESPAVAQTVRMLLPSARCLTQGPTVDRMRILLQPLVQAGGDRVANTRFVVVDSQEQNAFAYGGSPVGLVVFFTGHIRNLDSLANAATVPGGRTAETIGNVYLSTVIAHELSHLLLRHSADPTCRSVRPRLVARVIGGTEGSVAFADSAAACRTFLQRKELAADSVGSALLIAAYGSNLLGAFSDLARLWEQTDVIDRQDGFGLDETRVTSTHPSGIRRSAAFLRIWASYLEQQDRYDAAAALIMMNIDIPRAVALLDTVAKALPGDPRIDELRSAALVRAWLSTVPVQTLGLKPRVAVNSARFVEGVRGADDAIGDRSLLARARTSIRDLPEITSRPTAMVNLSIIESISGNGVEAERLASAALSMMPQRFAATNALAGALFRNGRADSAFVILAHMIDAGSRVASPDRIRSICTDSSTMWYATTDCFNAGRTLLARDRRNAVAILSVFASAENWGSGAWSREAARLIGYKSGTLGSVTTADITAPASGKTRTGRALPMRASSDQASGMELALGMSFDQARAVLGRNVRAVERSDGNGVMLVSDDVRVVVVMRGSSPATARVAAIGCVSPPSGWQIGGILPGASVQDLVARFGRPDSVSADETEALWQRDDVKLVVVLSGGRVRTIVISTD